jgi:hypothetical protein
MQGFSEILEFVLVLSRLTTFSRVIPPWTSCTSNTVIYTKTVCTSVGSTNVKMVC